MKPLFRQPNAFTCSNRWNVQTSQKNRFFFDLERTLYNLSFSRNLIMFQDLYSKVFFLSFHIYPLILQNSIVVVMVKWVMICFNFHLIMFFITSCLCINFVPDEKSFMLWHLRGHTSIKRIKSLVNHGLLETVDFTDFDSCVD